MRSKGELLKDGTNREKLILEVLLDIRELLKPEKVKKKKKETGTYVCEICGKVCTKRVALVGHMRSHK